MSDKKNLIDSGVLEEYTTINNEDVKKVEEEEEESKVENKSKKREDSTETEELDIRKVKIKEKKMYIESSKEERSSFDSQDSSLLKKSHMSNSNLENSQFLPNSDSVKNFPKIKIPHETNSEKDDNQSVKSEPIVYVPLTKNQEEETSSVKLSSVIPIPSSPQNLSVRDYDYLTNNEEITEKTVWEQFDSWYKSNKSYVNTSLIIGGGLLVIVGGYLIRHRLKGHQR